GARRARRTAGSYASRQVSSVSCRGPRVRFSIRHCEYTRPKKSPRTSPLAFAPAAGGHPGEALVVLAEDFGVAQAGAEAAEQDAVQAGLRPGQAVVDPQALLPADDQAVLPEVGQVPGDGRLGQRQRLVQVADADLVPVAAEEVQEPEPHGVGE